MKRCRGCGEVKPLSEFQKQKATKCGVRSRCKDCSRISHRAYRASSKGRAVSRRYNARDDRKAAQRQREEDKPLNSKARRAIKQLIKKGAIPPVATLTCAHCQERQAVNYHHPDYAKPLEVVPLCLICHCEAHNAHG